MCSWRAGQLCDEVSELEAGVSVNADERPCGLGEIGVLKTSALSNGSFDPSENKTVWPKEVARARIPVPGDSILVSRMNTPALVGESAYVAEAHPELFLPDRIWVLRMRDRECSFVRWLAHLLRGHRAKHYISVNATGTSGSMKNLPKSRLLAMPIMWPPYLEQRRIAEILDTLDEAIGKTSQIVAKLKQVRQGVLHDLLTLGIDADGELRDPVRHPEQFATVPDLGRIPRNWSVQAFGELCESSAFGPRFPGGRYAVDGALATLRTTDMNDDGEMDLASMPRAAISPYELQQHLLRTDDLVISRSGTCGIAGVFPGHSLPVVPGAFLIRFRLKTPSLAQLYRRYFNSALGRPRLERLAVGGVQKNIKGTDILSLRVPAVPMAEAALIIAAIDAADLRTSKELAELRKLELIKLGLMEDLLTGKVRVSTIARARSPVEPRLAQLPLEQ